MAASVGALAAVLLDRKEHACRCISFGSAAVASFLLTLVGVDVLLGGDLDLFLEQGTTLLTVPIIHLHVDKLSAFFLVALGLIGVAASFYSIGYAREYSGHYSVGRFGALFNLFLLSLVLVFTASNLVLFLVAWELMSLSSYFLVIYEHGREGVLSSGLLYLVMTHIGTALITTALIIISLQAHSLEFGSMHNAGALMDPTLRSVVFVLLFLGFGTKAGIVPLHVWLPQAHPAAPSSVSALMSGIMIKTAVFMLIRCTFELLGTVEAWWGLLLLLVGSISALLGVLYALMEKDIKRILAFSSIENIGIVFIALGSSIVFDAYGLKQLAALALIAALLHSFNHALFKGLLFLGAGALAYATGTKNIELMGGLAKRMKWTGVLFFVGVLSIAAIPPFNGFVSEWLIFQSLLLSFSLNDVVVNILLAVALGTLALTGALAAACFVRVYGIAFLARPRSEKAAKAHEVSGTMLFGMSVLAVLCVGAGVLSTFYIPTVDSVSASVLHVSIASTLIDGLVLETPTSGFSAMSPALLGLALIALLALVVAFSRIFGGRTRTVEGDTWDCGTPLGPRNEYTATGYSQPINRVFNSIFRSQSRTTVLEERSAYLRRLSYSTSVQPIFERYLYEPTVKLATGLARRVGVIQTGSIQAYLAYIFATLVILLLIFR
ncbi:MAG: hydrogenase 4 subunit B [Methanomassiliicoccales archaeon]|nr:hydrogenase 4 subunit B [Methanomassiliicoccales archaeon]